MFRTVELQSDGSVHVERGLAPVRPPPLGSVRWIDLTDPSDPLLALLAERFGFPSLTLDTCAHTSPRAKVEAHGDYLFVSTCGVAARTPVVGAMRWHELYAVLGRTCLVTVHLRDIPALDGVWRRVESEPELLGKGPGFIHYLLARGLASDSAEATTHMTDELDRLSRKVAANRDTPDVQAIALLRSQLLELRSVVAPQRQCTADLSLKCDQWLSPRTLFHFRDLHQLLDWMTDALDADCEQTRL